MAGVLNTERDTERRTPPEDTEKQEGTACEDGGRDWSGGSTRQGTPGLSATNHQKLGRSG